MYLNNTKTVQMSVIGGVIPWAPKIPWVSPPKFSRGGEISINNLPCTYNMVNK